MNIWENIDKLNQKVNNDNNESLAQHIRYSHVITNKELLKDKKLTDKLRKLDYKELSGGFGAVLNYPDENPSKIVIAYDDNEPVGWISVTNGYQNIYVINKYRKTGVASKLKDIIYNRK